MLFKLEKLFVDERTYWRTDIAPLMLLGRLGVVDLINCWRSRVGAGAPVPHTGGDVRAWRRPAGGCCVVSCRRGCSAGRRRRSCAERGATSPTTTSTTWNDRRRRAARPARSTCDHTEDHHRPTPDSLTPPSAGRRPVSPPATSYKCLLTLLRPRGRTTW